MATMVNLKGYCLYALALLLIPQQVAGTQYVVGDLNNWGVPPSGNPLVYLEWAGIVKVQTGDSLLFLYPPYADSVIQVTAENFKSCNIATPMFSMDDGNSVFDFTSNGEYFFTSGTPGRCEQLQKLHVVVGTTSAYPQDYGFEKLPSPASPPPPYSSNSTSAPGPSSSASSNSTSALSPVSSNSTSSVSPPRSTSSSIPINASWLLTISIGATIILAMRYF